ncbi:Hypothetical protein LUCI_0032, partial [Lucifera butyrica]
IVKDDHYPKIGNKGRLLFLTLELCSEKLQVLQW